MAEIVAFCVAQASAPPIAHQDVCLANEYAESSEAALYKNAMVLCNEYFSKDQRILDVGAATGAMGQLLRTEGFEDIHAVDCSKTLLSVAENKQIYRSSVVELPEDSGEPPALASCSFDGAIAVAAFDPGRFKPDYCKEIFRVLKMGGIAIVASREHYLKDLSTSHQQWPHHLEKSLQELENARKWGLTDRRVFSLDPDSDSKENNGIYLVFKKGCSNLTTRWKSFKPIAYRPSHNINDLFNFEDINVTSDGTSELLAFPIEENLNESKHRDEREQDLQIKHA